VTTSQLLTTGVDIPTCKNIVIARVVGSMVEFKQIIGRGTRVRDDYDKYYFNILDYTGSATRLFADRDFDGDPALVTEQEMTQTGEMVREVTTEEPGVAEVEEGSGPVLADDSEGVRRKYYFDGGNVEIAAHLVYELDPDGRQLRVVKFSEYAAEKVRTLYPSAADLRKQWADPALRAEIIAKLEERGIDFDQLRKPATSPRPTLSICCATSLSTVRCGRGASVRIELRKMRRFSSKNTLQKRVRFLRIFWKNMPSTAPRSSSSLTFSKSRRYPTAATSSRLPNSSAGRRSCGTRWLSCRRYSTRRRIRREHFSFQPARCLINLKV